MPARLVVTLRKSSISEKPRVRAVVTGLGLSKVNSSRVLPDNPSIRGALARISHLVEVREEESEGRDQGSVIRSQGSGVRGQGSGVRGQGSE